jgi:hypothetical protein
VDSKNTAPVLTPFYKQKVYLNKEDFKHPKFGNTLLISQWSKFLRIAIEIRTQELRNFPQMNEQIYSPPKVTFKQGSERNPPNSVESFTIT